MANLSPNQPLRPLSVGDVVSAGVRIYRAHLTTYLTLSAFAHLWLIVPIYGWAKSAEISGRISRLAFGIITNQPESPAQAEQKTHPAMWNFFVAGLLVGLLFYGMYIAGVIILLILVLIGSLAAVALGSEPNSPTTIIMIGFLALIGIIGILVVFIRVFSRLMIVEVPIAVEDYVDGVSAIQRSWMLTQGAVGRIQLIVIATFLITLIVNIPVQIVALILPSGEDAGLTAILLSQLVLIGVSLVCNMFVMPLWQAIKAVLYYDLRARREGMGLQLRPR
jgi:hypothetical protein